MGMKNNFWGIFFVYFRMILARFDDFFWGSILLNFFRKRNKKELTSS